MHLVYELELPEAETVLFGFTGTPMDRKSFSIVKAGGDDSRKPFESPGPAHAAAYPIEVVVARKGDSVRVRLVNVMYRGRTGQPSAEASPAALEERHAISPPAIRRICAHGDEAARALRKKAAANAGGRLSCAATPLQTARSMRRRVARRFCWACRSSSGSRARPLAAIERLRRTDV